MYCLDKSYNQQTLYNEFVFACTSRYSYIHMLGIITLSVDYVVH